MRGVWLWLSWMRGCVCGEYDRVQSELGGGRVFGGWNGLEGE